MEEESIDLLALGKVLLNHIKFILLVTVLMTICAFAITKIFIMPKYTSSALLYVENKTTASSDDSLSLNDINVAQQLVNTCTIIFTSDTVMEELSNDSRVDYSADVLRDMISVSSVNSTEVMNISVECYDPNEATYLANKMVEICITEYSRIIQSGTITEVTAASNNTTPSSPNTVLNTAIGFLIGLVLSCAIVLVRELLDTSIKSSDDISKMYNIPVFAEIADFNVAPKNKDRYEYKYSAN